MSRKQFKRRAGRMAHVVMAGFFILVIAGGVGFGVASADSSDDLARAGAFGFDEATHAATMPAASEDDGAAVANESLDTLGLASAPSRDISTGLKMVDEREAEEKARIEQENAAAIARMESQKAMQGVVTPVAEPEAAVEEQAIEYDLPAVDWTVGKDAFIEEWTARIDDYLRGTALDGYGSVFADAAWENGVDPRWSPAISNTESTNGAHCFLSHNAWGWGQDSWPDWDSAIRAHVAGLASKYGYSITLSAAQIYCPPNYEHWFSNTLGQMALI